MGPSFWEAVVYTAEPSSGLLDFFVVQICKHFFYVCLDSEDLSLGLEGCRKLVDIFRG